MVYFAILSEFIFSFLRDPKKAESIMQKLHMAVPKKRDNKVRDATIPDTVL